MFKFTDEQLLPYRDKTPDWGTVGVLTYKRTYSRPIFADEEVARREEWLETIVRVIEGNVNLGISVGDPTATEEWALEALEYMFHMSVMPPGRGYWMMGTEYASVRGGDALNNCWYVAVKPQDYEDMDMFKGTWDAFSTSRGLMPSFPFVFMFDRAMLGGGVGFGISKKNLSAYPDLSTKVRLHIVLDKDHPDWDRIRGSEEWEKFNLIGHVFPKEVPLPGTYACVDVADDREGWATSVREVIDGHWYKPIRTKPVVNLVLDLSKVRGYGEVIKGFGGTASGPLPLIAALVSINNILNSRVGKNLRGVDGLDIMNILGRCVVAGNVRRTALISLGDADDKDYVDAKNYTLIDPITAKDENGYAIWETNKWGRQVVRLKDWEQALGERVSELRDGAINVNHPYAIAELVAQAEEELGALYDMAWKQDNHRWASNNSVYTNELFKDHHFIAAGIIANGEPGVGNEWLMKNFGRIKDGYQEAIDADAEGLNPCAEITLENGEPCNLVEFVPYVARKKGHDSCRCLTIAAQYVYRITFAKYMWPVVQRVISKNRRVGVSLTGMQDYFLDKYGRYAVDGFEDGDITKPKFYQPIADELDTWYGWVKSINNEHAELLGTEPSIKLTTVKPSGTVAKLPGVSSGIHWHYAPYMIQRMRFHETDPNLKVVRTCGFPIEKAIKEPNSVVVEFPIKNPGAEHPNFRSAGEVPLEEHFANQYLFAYYWADNAVSATLTFKPEYDANSEVDKIQPLLESYNNRIKSTSLLPYSGHGYVQAPWEPITKEQYEERIAKISIKPEEVYDLMLKTGVNILGSDDILDADCEGGACPTR